MSVLRSDIKWFYPLEGDLSKVQTLWDVVMVRPFPPSPSALQLTPPLRSAGTPRSPSCSRPSVLTPIVPLQAHDLVRKGRHPELGLGDGEGRTRPQGNSRRRRGAQDGWCVSSPSLSS